MVLAVIPIKKLLTERAIILAAAQQYGHLRAALEREGQAMDNLTP